jgi:hypothetical protein
MRWVTQRRPKIDRLASPWLIRRFVDPQAEFLFVPATEVRNTAASAGAIPFDVPLGTPGADLVHPPGGTSFDVIREKFRLDDPALAWLARIVRDADNDNALRRLPEAAGLRAISLGLARRLRDDHERLAYGMVLYDALYEWASRAAGEDAVVARTPRLHQALCVLGAWLSRIRERRALADLDDHLLRDVGLTREQAGREASKPFWHM